MKKNKWFIAAGVTAGLAAGLSFGCKKLNKKEQSSEELSEMGTERCLPLEATFYEKYVKRALDVGLSFCGIIVLAPVLAISSATVYLEDPGPVVFKQKRVGIHKTYFHIHKLRSMKLDTPDVPTHLLENPEQYILKTGKIYRKLSIDELYQLFDILRGRMSIVGPRPALWNQDDLISERDKYGANDVLPGLTGWAQINGRDELEIEDKAKLDGDYVAQLRRSSWAGFRMDLRCFLGTIISVLISDGVVEGGRDNNQKNVCLSNECQHMENNVWQETRPDDVKKILIVGENSYIGENIKQYLEQYPQYYIVDVLSSLNLLPRVEMFHGYDVVFNVAGIAHVKETKRNHDLFYTVNRDLCVEVANNARAAGVKQMIELSSMSVYGMKYGHIEEDMVPNPNSAYGDSKYQADKKLMEMETTDFRVAIIRPPMVYGKGCKGNYQLLRKLALITPIFPDYTNKRSMIYIGNLCEFVKNIIDEEKSGIYFPQNKEYVSTREMVRLISRYNGKSMVFVRWFNPLIKYSNVSILNKMFGDLTYEKKDVVSKYCFSESIELSEK